MSKKRCKGINKLGNKCQAYAKNSGYCFVHDATNGQFPSGKNDNMFDGSILAFNWLNRPQSRVRTL